MSKEVSVDWKAALQKQVAVAQEATPEPTGGVPKISLRHGRMTMGEKPLPGDELQCIIIASKLERTFFDRAYDADDLAPPNCFALGENAADLVPHENVKNPPSDSCSGCPMAEFGTARQGRGPACKTKLRLLVTPAPDNVTPDQLKHPELATMAVSPTSVANFNAIGGKGKPPGYERMLAEKGITPWAVVSKIMVRPHSKKMHEVTFELIKPLGEDALLAASYALTLDADEHISQCWAYPDEDENAAPAGDVKSGAKY